MSDVEHEPTMEATEGESDARQPGDNGPAPAPASVVDLLVEEVSIDGMCGVY